MLHLKPLAGLSPTEERRDDLTRPAPMPCLRPCSPSPHSPPTPANSNRYTRAQSLLAPHRALSPSCFCRLWPPYPRTLSTHKLCPQSRGRVPVAERPTRRSAQAPPRGRKESAGSYDDLMRRIGSDGGGRGGLQPLVPAELKSDVHKLNRRIKNMNAFLLDPKSKFMQTWDFFTLSALFFTLTVTPFEARAPPPRAPPPRTAPHRTARHRAASPLITISACLL